MPSTFFGLNIGTSGLYTYQAALNTTAHNISNAETTGYTRQVLNQSASKPISVYSSYGMVGTGVTGTSITQTRNSYYDTKYRMNNSLYGMYKTKEYYMSSIENYFNEVNDTGFTKSFTYLSGAMQTLSDDPSDETKRTQVVNYASQLTDYFKTTVTSLQAVQEEANTELKASVDRINSIAEQVAMLTKQINVVEVGGEQANDLRDARNVLLDELSSFANITVEERKVGFDSVGTTAFEVRMDGQLLVDSTDYNTLQLISRTEKHNVNDVDGLYDVKWSNGQDFRLNGIGGNLQALYELRDGNNQQNLQGNASGSKGDTSVKLTGTNVNSVLQLNIPESGTITIGNQQYTYSSFDFAVVDGKYEYTFQLDSPLKVDATGNKGSVGESIDYKGIPYYMDQMNQFARTFASSFNGIHNGGQDLYGNAGLDIFNATNKVTGENYNFTEDFTASGKANSYYYLTAANFTINSEIVADVKKLATGSDMSQGIEQKDILDKLVACIDDKSMFSNGTPSSFLQTLVANVGVDSKKASNFADNQKNILASISNQRLSESGVDTDEEGVNLIKYQNAYGFSSKVISVMNEVLDKLINETGV
ncbi:flagellar hook-associated protein FlgK [Lachnospiraceae bacterium KM106-2]|nr:flagellar hook-associated protein FlgK [Lachnospiraceae bacterium KM106-2]